MKASVALNGCIAWVASGRCFHYQQRSYPPKTPLEVVEVILLFRRRFHWGGNRIAAELKARQIYPISPQGVYNVLRRYRCRTRTYHPVAVRKGILYRRYEAPRKNDLWHLDFAGPFTDADGHKLYALIVIDDYSRFLLDIIVCDSLETQPVCDHLQRLFDQYGKPARIMTDNGRTFTSVWEDGRHRFTDFLHQNGIEHKSIQPLYPEANGKAEAAVKIVKKEVIAPLPARSARSPCSATVALCRRWASGR